MTTFWTWLLFVSLNTGIHAWVIPSPRHVGHRWNRSPVLSTGSARLMRPEAVSRFSSTSLSARQDETEGSVLANPSDQTVVGVVGTLAALITLYSEFTLKTTGCGLPPGPLGLLGLAEGLSYLAIIAIAGLSVFNKVKTGSGLPAGPGGLLGAAEGLSFLAILAGLVVLGFQIVDYGYIPNAVPTEGARCS